MRTKFFSTLFLFPVLFVAVLFFGGRITSIFPCTAAPGTLLLTVGPPVGGTFLYVPGASRLFSYFSVKPGSYVLGMASPAGTCPFFAFSGGELKIRSKSAGGTIIMMGTSGL